MPLFSLHYINNVEFVPVIHRAHEYIKIGTSTVFHFFFHILQFDDSFQTALALDIQHTWCLMMDETKETCLIKIERLLKPYINLTERIRNNMNADEEMTPYRFLYLCKTGDRKSLQEIGFKKYSIDILTTVFKCKF